MKKLLLSALLFVLISVACFGQLPVLPRDTSSIKKPMRPSYAYLDTIPEYKTNIVGEVVQKMRPYNTTLYPKDKLFSDTFHLINNGAKFELLNEKSPFPNRKTFDRILVKITSNPPNNEFVSEKGWMEVERTSLFKYLDHDKGRIDTNYLVNKYAKAAGDYRANAAKTKCAANKKCYLAWADYYDCVTKGGSNGKPAACPLPSCALTDCPEDK